MRFHPRQRRSQFRRLTRVQEDASLDGRNQDVAHPSHVFRKRFLKPVTFAEGHAFSQPPTTQRIHYFYDDRISFAQGAQGCFQRLLERDADVMQHDPGYLQAVLEHLFCTDAVDLAVLGAGQVIHHDHAVKLALFAHPKRGCLFYSLWGERRVIPLYDGYRSAPFARVRHRTRELR